MEPPLGGPSRGTAVLKSVDGLSLVSVAQPMAGIEPPEEREENNEHAGPH